MSSTAISKVIKNDTKLLQEEESINNYAKYSHDSGSEAPNTKEGFINSKF